MFRGDCGIQIVVAVLEAKWKSVTVGSHRFEA